MIPRLGIAPTLVDSSPKGHSCTTRAEPLPSHNDRVRMSTHNFSARNCLQLRSTEPFLPPTVAVAAKFTDVKASWLPHAAWRSKWWHSRQLVSMSGLSRIRLGLITSVLSSPAGGRALVEPLRGQFEFWEKASSRFVARVFEIT